MPLGGNLLVVLEFHFQDQGQEQIGADLLKVGMDCGLYVSVLSIAK